ncbi:MAG: AAA-like domain-containing protein [Cyanobacteria bacterium P01_A01_bin.116]
MARVFISYKRTVEPDEPIAKRLYQALSARHEVFIDQAMLVGTRWAEQIESQLRQTDVLIVLLSEHSVGSEMVVQEVSLAHELYKTNGTKPRILPVRLAYEQPFQYPLSAYLAAINWASWQGEADTAGLIDELERAIAGETLSKSKLAKPIAESSSAIPKPTPAAQPHRSTHRRPSVLDLPEGTMDVASAFYVARPADGIALETVGRPNGVTITIKGPRQMGKSSLLNRVMAKAVDAGKQVAFLDFQLFDREALQNADAFYQQFCYWLTDELEIEDCFEEYWSKPLGSTQRCTRYVGRHILKSIDGPLVLAMDEVERMFDTPFRNDFFSMLRSWHNQRATKKLWKNLDLALVTSTEPYQLIDDLNQSPFNVGQVLRLEDFDAAQVHGLNVSHGEPLTATEEQQLMALVNGHPYLVRKALYLVASGQMTADELFKSAGEEKGPFGDHLRYHLFRVYGKKELVKGFLRILKDQSCPDEVIYFRLHGAGLVSREGALVVPRCQLYASFFGEHLG